MIDLVKKFDGHFIGQLPGNAGQVQRGVGAAADGAVDDQCIAEGGFIPGGSMRPGPRQTTSLVAGDISLRQKRQDAISDQEIRDYAQPSQTSVVW